MTTVAGSSFSQDSFGGVYVIRTQLTVPEDDGRDSYLTTAVRPRTAALWVRAEGESAGENPGRVVLATFTAAGY